MQKKEAILLLYVLILLFLFACAHPGDPADPGVTPAPTGTLSPSPAPSVVLDAVTNLHGSYYKDTTGIYLSWDAVFLPELTYNLYRSSGKNNFDSNTVKVVTEITTNEYMDTTAARDTLYYYKVSYVYNRMESPLSTAAGGIYAAFIDNFENNNTRLAIAGKGNTPSLNTAHTAYLYSLPDGAGDVEADIDWYKYRGEAKQIFIDVSPAADTDLGGSVLFELYFNGLLKINDSINSDRTFSFSDYGGATGTVEVLFRVFIDKNSVNKAAAVVEDYRIKLSDEFEF